MIVPLVSLMKDQVNDLVSRGIPASYVGYDCSEDQLRDILDFKARIVFGSPEALLNTYRHIFRHLKSNLKAACLYSVQFVNLGSALWLTIEQQYIPRLQIK